MIRCENDNGVVQDAILFHKVQQTSKLRVGICDKLIVGVAVFDKLYGWNAPPDEGVVGFCIWAIVVLKYAYEVFSGEIGTVRREKMDIRKKWLR
jgi:hypothetical protein